MNYTELQKYIGDKVKQLRIHHKLNQNDLALKLNVSRTCIVQIETYKQSVTMKK